MVIDDVGQVPGDTVLLVRGIGHVRDGYVRRFVRP
jgi:hypothetical protein